VHPRATAREARRGSSRFARKLGAGRSRRATTNASTTRAGLDAARDAKSARATSSYATRGASREDGVSTGESKKKKFGRSRDRRCPAPKKDESQTVIRGEGAGAYSKFVEERREEPGLAKGHDRGTARDACRDSHDGIHRSRWVSQRHRVALGRAWFVTESTRRTRGARRKTNDGLRATRAKLRDVVLADGLTLPR